MARPTCLLLLLTAFVAAGLGNQISLRGRELSTRDLPSISSAENHHFRSLGSNEVHQFLVVVDGLLTSADRKLLETFANVKLGYYFQERAFLVTGTKEEAQKLEQAPHVEKVVSYLPEYRIDPAIRYGSNDMSRDSSSTTKADRKFVILLITHPNLPTAQQLVDPWNAQLAALFGEGVAKVTADESPRTLTLILSDNVSADVARAVLEWVSQQPAVHFAERAVRYKLLNKSAQWITQSGSTDSRPFWDAGIRGSGQVVGVADSGIDYGHCFFYDPDVPVPLGTVNTNHRKIIAYWKSPGGDYTEDVDGHGTHVSGSVAGATQTSDPDDFAAVSPYNGMAPAAKLAFYDIGRTGEDGMYPPNDLSQMLKPFYEQTSARIHTNSWGCAVPNDQPPTVCNIYDTQTSTLDEFLEEHEDMFVLFAAGNDGSGYEGNPEGLNTVGAPATSKNALSVGASMNDYIQSLGTLADYTDYNYIAQEIAPLLANAGLCDTTGMDPCPTTESECCTWSGPNGESVAKYCCKASVQAYYASLPQSAYNIENLAEFSSRGPASDGYRYKPDVVAPGQYIVSAHSNGDQSEFICSAISPDLTNSAALMANQGTSMATPVTAGNAALVRQYFVDGYYPSTTKTASDGFTPSGALLKAVLVHSASPLTGTVVLAPGQSPVSLPSYDVQSNRILQGYGRINLASALPLAPPETAGFALYIDDHTDEKLEHGGFVKYAGTVTGGPFIVTLVWTDPASSPNSRGSIVNDLDLEVHVGGTVYYGNQLPNGARDSHNNVEKVIIESLSQQDVTVVVKATKVNKGPQSFALVMTAENFGESFTVSSDPGSASSGNTLTAWVWLLVTAAVGAVAAFI